MSRLVLPHLRQWCRWQNDIEFCASIEQWRVKPSVLAIVTLFSLTLLSAVGGLLMAR
jgi:hypothetical protein